MDQLATKAEAATEAHQHILALKENITRDFILLGRELHQVKLHKFYRALGYDSFASYLATPDVSLSLSSAYTLIDIFSTFLVKFGVPEHKLLPIGRKKLEIILPVVDQDNYERWLGEAENLSVSDLLNQLRESRGKKVFEYKFTKESRIAFKGETHMERILEKRLTLNEIICSACEKAFWTESSHQATHCTYCGSTEISVNGTVTYKDAAHIEQAHEDAT